MNKVEKALSKIKGMSPDNIAKFLLKRGIKGISGNGASCPIARYIRKETGIKKSVYVYSDYIVIGKDSEIDTPKNISRFVLNFDRGDYSRLKE